MRMRTVILGVSLVFGVGLMCEASAQAVAQNANKPAAARKAKPAKKAPEAKPAAAAPAAAPAQAAAEKPMAKPKPKRKASMAMSGVPNGVPNCIKHLAKMAEKDPLINYDGHPSEIVNNGLMWNDPKSHCSIGSDDAMRKKVVEMANAWRMKDSATVRSLLAELGSAAGSK
ncbi:MAG TPA: hypothetical protein VK747_04050 [Blastocatellia bacterium]|nr:hypothetical protein [Blastocatellia bacterium]